MDNYWVGHRSISLVARVRYHVHVEGPLCSLSFSLSLPLLLYSHNIQQLHLDGIVSPVSLSHTLTHRVFKLTSSHPITNGTVHSSKPYVLFYRKANISDH